MEVVTDVGGGVWPLTLTGPIRPSQDGALLHLAKGLKEAPHVVLALLLAQHPHKQLPVLWMEGRTERKKVEEDKNTRATRIFFSRLPSRQELR